MFDKIIEIYVVVHLLWVKLNKLQRNKNRHQQGQTIRTHDICIIHHITIFLVKARAQCLENYLF